MTTQPYPLTRAEWNEIGNNIAVRQAWGLEGDESFADFAADNIYGVKFNFHSWSLGYVGDLYILQGDTLTGDPPFVLMRDRSEKLIFAN